MLSPSQERDREQRIEEVAAYMRRLKLSIADLDEVGGEDLRARDPARVGKARAVERTWALMARLDVRHVDLVASGVCVYDFRARRPRHRKSSLKSLSEQVLNFSNASVGENDKNASPGNGLEALWAGGSRAKFLGCAIGFHDGANKDPVLVKRRRATAPATTPVESAAPLVPTTGPGAKGWPDVEKATAARKAWHAAHEGGGIS
jgi:hypothetical protein